MSDWSSHKLLLDWGYWSLKNSSLPGPRGLEPVPAPILVKMGPIFIAVLCVGYFCDCHEAAPGAAVWSVPKMINMIDQGEASSPQWRSLSLNKLWLGKYSITWETIHCIHSTGDGKEKVFTFAFYVYMVQLMWAQICGLHIRSVWLVKLREFQALSPVIYSRLNYRI